MANMDFCDKHNMVAFLQKPTRSKEFNQIFWQTATVETVNDGEQQITVTIDGQTIAITKASVRRHLQLADADGINSLPNTKIFEQLTLIRVNDSTITVDIPTHTYCFSNYLITYYISINITPTKVSQGEEQSQESFEVHLNVLSAAKILANASRERVKTYKSYTRRRRSTVSSRDSIAGGLFSTAEEILTQARKNMMIYLKNMAGYKMNYFKGMSYDEIRPIFKEEYNKIQTLFKKDTEVEKTMTKRVAEETLLQESFKRLRAVEASRSEPIQEQQTKNS
ncbi:hypothetical protein Tco_1390733 [Tanacetum coccineum]